MFSWSRTWEYRTWPWYLNRDQWGTSSVQCMKPKLTHVNELGMQLSTWALLQGMTESPCKKIKGINTSMLPLCQSALYEKVRRTNFVATLWKGASIPEPCSLSPMENGWVLVDGSYKMTWFEGDTVPQDVWRILDADTEVLEEVETDFNDSVTDELLYRARWLPRFWWVLNQ